ncbi:helix-turn-helix domain-containing protein, partial [Enterococcus hirae]|nr:helix-turn-helix domain-containing protein [Enterococcus hirae]
MEINHLYGKSIKKKITLINILYNKHDWIPTNELAKQSKLERKTVLKYISELENDIKLFNHSQIYINFSKGRGTILNADDPFIVQKFILWLIEENIAIKIVHTLFFENSLNITKWSYENYTSISTVRRTINQLKKTFKPL